MTPLVDGHLDLSWNAVSFERDLTLPVDEMNLAEVGCSDSAARGRGVVSLHELRQGCIRLCFATLLSRSKPLKPLTPNGAKRIDLDHRSPVIAHAAAHAQLAWYEYMIRRDALRMIKTADDLDDHWQHAANKPNDAPIGIVLVMEGADPVTEPGELEYWFERGLRQINMVHYGTNQYAAGTGAEGGITNEGRRLLSECRRLGVALDVAHLADQAFDEALDAFDGPVLASHQNCRALVSGQRQMTDDQLRRLIGREAVIGTAFDSWMLAEGWQLGKSPRELATLESVADHLDHICQLAGNDRCAAIGTDLDGGYGREQTPMEVDSIAHVQKLPEVLSRRGYGDESIAAIFHGNWLRWLRAQLPLGANLCNSQSPTSKRR